MAIVLGEGQQGVQEVSVVLKDAKGKVVGTFSASTSVPHTLVLPKTVQVKSIIVTPVVK